MRKDIFACPICKKHTTLNVGPSGQPQFSQNDELKQASHFYLQSINKMKPDKRQMLEFYQTAKKKRVKQSSQQMKIFQSMSATAQDIAIPHAYCELCTTSDNNASISELGPSSTQETQQFEESKVQQSSDPKARAVCECLNCNMPLCNRCKSKHTSNPRFAQHKILNYQQMIFNANKFGGNSSNNNSVSPTRRGTGFDQGKNKSPRVPQGDGVSMISANSSGKFSVRNALGGGGGILGGEPLEMMQCPSHEEMNLDHYSINIREFMCRQCIKEIEGTQREIDLNPIPVEEAFKFLEGRLNMQQLANLDEKIKGLYELVRKKRDFAMKDKDESLKQVNKQFELVYKRLDERKNALFQAIISMSDQEVGKIDALIESMSAIKERSMQMFQPITSNTSLGYARSVERILDFLNDMKDIQLPTKLTSTSLNNLSKVNVQLSDELLKQIDNLGAIQLSGTDQPNPLMQKLQNAMQQTITKVQQSSLITDDFSKPKNKLVGSRIIPEMAQSIKVLKVLPHFKESKLLYRWTPPSSEKPSSSGYEPSNAGFHQCCDDRGPLLVLVKLLTNGAIFGGFSGIPWHRIGGWRKTKQSYLISITDGRGREPFISKIKTEPAEASLRAIYFSEKFGIVFGTNDLMINFSDMEQSGSKLGGNYEVPEGMNENSLTTLSYITVNHSVTLPNGKTVIQPKTIVQPWDVEEIEVFSLMLYK